MKRFLALASVLALLSAGTLVWYLWPRRNAFYTDGALIRRPAQTAVLREILWQPPVRLNELINSPSDDYEPRMSPDGRTRLDASGSGPADDPAGLGRQVADGLRRQGADELMGAAG